MICKNCGFEFDEGEICPTCGDQLYDEAEIAPVPAHSEESQPEENQTEEPKPDEKTAEPERMHKKPSNKRIFIVLTSVICATVLICTAAIGTFVKITYSKLSDDITQAILNGYRIGTKNGWTMGYQDGWSDGYEQDVDDSEINKFEDYEHYDNYLDSPDEECNFPDGHLILKDYSSTKDTLSADKDVCEVSFSLEIFNDSDSTLSLNNITPSIYSVNSALSSTYDISNSFELISQSYPSGDYDELEIGAKESAIYEATFMGPKTDSADIFFSFANDESKYIVSASYTVSF